MPPVAAVVGVVASVASVAATVKGMQAQKQAARAGQEQAEQAAEDTKAYNADLLASIDSQQKQSADFRESQYRDTYDYTLSKGLRTLVAGAQNGWDKLQLTHDQLQGALDLTAAQQGDDRALARLSISEKEQQAGAEVAARIGFAVEDAGNQMGAAVEKHALAAKELALRDDAAVADHIGKQASRAMELRFGVGRLVATAAARGVAGGAATAAKVMAKQGAIQQATDDARLKLDRGLMQVAGLTADLERFRTQKGIEIGLDREIRMGQLQLDGLRRQNDLEYLSLTQRQDQDFARMTYDANRQLESGYLDFSSGIKAGVLDMQTRLGDLDFEHGVQSAQHAMEDAFRMENAQIDAKNNVAAAVHRNAYAQTMGNIQSSSATWQGMAGISSSLWTASENIPRLWAQLQPSTPISYGPSYSGGGVIGSNAIGGTGRLGGGV
ncbi:hypothetical protein [Azospirillum sp. sgz301742]